VADPPVRRPRRRGRPAADDAARLRHGAATLLIGAGAHPRVAQELLRHASSRTTMEIYGHVSAGQQREAVELLEKAIAG
jgi:integrase